MLNLGYRHKFNDNLSAVVTVQDVLRTQRDRVVIDTATLKDRFVVTPRTQAVFVGLTYSFGSNGRRARDPGFEFGGGEAPS